MVAGGGVLVLVPEVALAPRLSAVKNETGEKSSCLHSHLSAGERVDAWRSLIQNESRIVVGARSAVLLHT